MSLISMIKSIFGHSEADDGALALQAEPLEEDKLLRIPMFNLGMPVEVMENFNTTLFSGRLTAVNAVNLTIERLPGDLGFPIQEIGSEVLVRGYDDHVNPIILNGKVVKSSIIDCTVGDLSMNNYVNQRSDIRYPMNLEANIFELEDTHFGAPQSCQLLNISGGGGVYCFTVCL